MPRKTKEETELTRRKILDVALDVFAEKGYSRTTLQEIASRAGFTRGAVYWHFENKADLLTALAEDVEGDSADAFEDVRRINSRDDLKRALCDYLERFETDQRFGTFHRVVEYRTEWAEELTPLLERTRRELRELAQWMVAALHHLATLGEIEAARDPKKDGLALYIHVTGLYSIWMTDPEFLSMTRDAPEQIERFLASLAPHSSSQTNDRGS
ncbi:MAG: TetR family transcriptional regulator [Holophagales bacterium]|nr:TetR family transcriptional regulator [Holophagales bacterium]